MSTLKVSNIQDISNNAAMSISGGTVTFNNPTVGANQPQVQTHLITPSSQAITANVRANISGLNATITPSTSSKRIKVSVRWAGEYSNLDVHDTVFGIKRDSTDVGNPAAAGSRHVGIAGISLGFSGDNASTTMDSTTYSYIDSPATTSAITYSATYLQDIGGTLYNQRTVSDSDSRNQERLTSSITLEEID